MFKILCSLNPLAQISRHLPDNFGDEDVLLFWYSGTWNDYSTAYAGNGYIVEYEKTAGIPEPTTLWLLLTGLIMLWWVHAGSLPLLKVRRM